MSEREPITFTDDGLTYMLRVDIAETVCDENGPAYPRLIDGRDATPADLRATGYVPVTERDVLAAQVATMRGALDDFVKAVGSVTGGKDTDEWAHRVLDTYAAFKSAIILPATAAEERVRAVIEAAREFRQNAVPVNPQGASARFALDDALRALDGKAGASDGE